MRRTVYFTKKSMHMFDGLNPYADQARLRYYAFRPLNWDVAYFDDDEWEEDEYDVPPHTEYLVYYEGNEALGCCRLVRTNSCYKLGSSIKSYMLRDVFNGASDYSRNLLNDRDSVVDSNEILEGTRFAIAPHLNKSENKKKRNHVISELTVAMVKRCLDRDITAVVGIMYVGIWTSVWEKRGCAPDWLGPEVDLDGQGVLRAGKLPINEDVLKTMQKRTGVNHINLCGEAMEAQTHQELII